MKAFRVLGILAALLAATIGLVVQASAQSDTVSGAGPQHIDFERGHQKSGGGSSPLVIWHNGTIMPTANVYAIFWGASWPGYTGDKISGMQSFYSGFGGSKYAGTGDEYTGTNGSVTSTVSFGGTFIDGSSAPHNPNTSAILREVASVVPTSKLVSNGFYAVYGDVKGAGGFCAWHSFGTVNGVTIQVAWVPNLDGVSGCDPLDTSGLHSEGLAAIADSSAHELSEARTDPTNGGWYDNGGAEVGDKCNFIYQLPLVTLSNKSQWKIQSEWSNAAYNAGTGYPNSLGQNGCISG
ncbi:MAG TPA: hypothetical protein VF221_01210 [Chloroflexota bacterium]